MFCRSWSLCRYFSASKISIRNNHTAISESKHFHVDLRCFILNHQFLYSIQRLAETVDNWFFCDFSIPFWSTFILLFSYLRDCTSAEFSVETAIHISPLSSSGRRIEKQKGSCDVCNHNRPFCCSFSANACHKLCCNFFGRSLSQNQAQHSVVLGGNSILHFFFDKSLGLRNTNDRFQTGHKTVIVQGLISRDNFEVSIQTHSYYKHYTRSICAALSKILLTFMWHFIMAFRFLANGSRSLLQSSSEVITRSNKLGGSQLLKKIIEQTNRINTLKHCLKKRDNENSLTDFSFGIRAR